MSVLKIIIVCKKENKDKKNYNLHNKFYYNKTYCKNNN